MPYISYSFTWLDTWFVSISCLLCILVNTAVYRPLYCTDFTYLDTYELLRLLGIMGVLRFTFLRATTLFSTLTVPIHVSTNSIRGFLFFISFPKARTCFCLGVGGTYIHVYVRTCVEVSKISFRVSTLWVPGCNFSHQIGSKYLFIIHLCDSSHCN